MTNFCQGENRLHPKRRFAFGADTMSLGHMSERLFTTMDLPLPVWKLPEEAGGSPYQPTVIHPLCPQV